MSKMSLNNAVYTIVDDFGYPVKETYFQRHGASYSAVREILNALDRDNDALDADDASTSIYDVIDVMKNERNNATDEKTFDAYDTVLAILDVLVENAIEVQAEENEEPGIDVDVW